MATAWSKASISLSFLKKNLKLWLLSFHWNSSFSKQRLNTRTFSHQKALDISQTSPTSYIRLCHTMKHSKIYVITILIFDVGRYIKYFMMFNECFSRVYDASRWIYSLRKSAHAYFLLNYVPKANFIKSVNERALIYKSTHTTIWIIQLVYCYFVGTGFCCDSTNLFS